MFNYNELIFLDELVSEYLKFHQDLPLNVRNHVLKLDNKILEYMNNIKEAKQREIEEDAKYVKKIVI